MTTFNKKSGIEKKYKVILIILDGFGFGSLDNTNAIYLAQPETFNNFIKNYPTIKINASEEYVGLPKNQPGNSEVGHQTIGAGRIFYTGLGLINQAIKDNSFFQNQLLINTIKQAQQNKKNIHLMGLASNGDVHASLGHLFKLIDLCNQHGVTPIIDLFTDGRDTKEKQFIHDLEIINKHYLDQNKARLGIVSGRYYAMDRNQNWDRTQKAYNQFFVVNNNQQTLSSYIASQYENSITDEFIEPKSFNTNQTILKEGDLIIFFNFRSDRIRQLYHMFSQNSEDYDYINPNAIKCELVGFMDYKLKAQNNIAFIQPENNIYLGKIIEQNNLKQLRIAETEKYAHVTYFMDSLHKETIKNCDQVLIPSPDVKTYDLMPEMSASKITDYIIQNYKKYDLVIANYANSDMVGHTGVMKAAISAIKTLDYELKKIYENIVLKDDEYVVLVTADHGNSDKMIDENGIIVTSHTTNKVPFILLNKSLNWKKDVGSLTNITPTILKLMQIEKPDCMDDSLI